MILCFLVSTSNYANTYENTFGRPSIIGRKKNQTFWTIKQKFKIDYNFHEINYSLKWAEKS